MLTLEPLLLHVDSHIVPAILSVIGRPQFDVCLVGRVGLDTDGSIGA